MIYGAGVDVGSTQTKAVIVDEARRIVARALIDTGANVTRAGENAFVRACELGGLPREAVGYVVGTGYGRYKVTFGDAQITEITCHARGAHSLFPATRTVIDMGGQDTKAIKVGPDGSVLDFSMNDKCAAGTGRFLSAAADVTGVGLDEIGPLSLQATAPVRLTSVCTVFVESDIMSYLAQRKTIEDILGGVHKAIATRTMSLIRRVGVEEEVTFTGGVSRNIGMVRGLEAVIGCPINVSPEGHFMGALGAALFALERAQAAAEKPATGSDSDAAEPPRSSLRPPADQAGLAAPATAEPPRASPRPPTDETAAGTGATQAGATEPGRSSLRPPTAEAGLAAPATTQPGRSSLRPPTAEAGLAAPATTQPGRVSLRPPTDETGLAAPATTGA